MVGDRIIAYAGKLFVHVVRALLVCWQRMLRLGLSVGALSGLVVLVLGAYVTRTIPPAPLTWIVALIFGFALGYAAAMTVLADEILLSIVESIRMLEGDVRAGMRAAVIAAEREAGEAGRGITRFLGHPRKAQRESTPAVERAAPSQPLVTLSSIEHDELGQEQANETLAAVAATEEFITTAPRPAVNARPVRADQLPRIGWARDDADTLRSPGAVIATVPAPALAEMPPLPIRPLRSPLSRVEASAPAVLGENGAQAVDAVAVPSAPYSDDAMTRSMSDSASHDDGETLLAATTDAVTQTAAPDEAHAFATGASDAAPAGVKRPAAEAAPVGEETTLAADQSPVAASQPIEPDKEERGIWARIGRALIGNTTVPLHEMTTAENEDSSQTEANQP